MINFFKNFIALLIGCFIAFIILELFLQIYQPIPTTIKWDKIRLPINQYYRFKNNWHTGLDVNIIHTKNSLGFRGKEIPENYQKKVNIIAVGGSTTECMYISDGKDWPNLLSQRLKHKIPNLWINNAGFDGHSTFGHQILMEKHIKNIKPNSLVLRYKSKRINWL